MADATPRLSRRWGGSLAAPGEAWIIAIDGAVVGALANRQTVEVAVEPGHHLLRLGQGPHLSPERSFAVADGETVSFRGHGPRVGGWCWRRN